MEVKIFCAFCFHIASIRFLDKTIIWLKFEHWIVLQHRVITAPLFISNLHLPRRWIFEFSLLLSISHIFAFYVNLGKKLEIEFYLNWIGIFVLLKCIGSATIVIYFTFGFVSSKSFLFLIYSLSGEGFGAPLGQVLQSCYGFVTLKTQFSIFVVLPKLMGSSGHQITILSQNFVDLKEKH